MEITTRVLNAHFKRGFPYHGGRRVSFDMPRNSVPQDPELALGRRIYYNSCVYCHGVEGHGDSVMVCAKNPLSGKNLSEAQIRFAIENPRLPMPRVRLTAAEIQAIVLYVYQFRASARSGGTR